jgi:ArsR family metal-binding transcriptional regulator
MKSSNICPRYGRYSGHWHSVHEMTYLDSITLVRTIPCLAEPGKIIVVGKPTRTLEEALPYLATLPGVTAWNPRAIALTFRRQPGFLTIQRDQIFITQVKDVEEGLSLLNSLKDAINTVWEKREDLVAVTNFKRAPNHLDIWELLPRTNCSLCGEATCLAFAVALMQQNRTLDECPAIQADLNYADRRAALSAMIPAL